MLFEREKDTVSGFDRISLRSAGEKSPSGPIKTLIFFSFPRSFELSIYLEFTSAKNNFFSFEMLLIKSLNFIILLNSGGFS